MQFTHFMGLLYIHKFLPEVEFLPKTYIWILKTVLPGNYGVKKDKIIGKLYEVCQRYIKKKLKTGKNLQ